MKKIFNLLDKLSGGQAILFSLTVGGLLGTLAYVLNFSNLISLIQISVLILTLITTWNIYEKEHMYSVKIGINYKSNVEKTDAGGLHAGNEFIIGLWIVNTGNVTGSFRFVGIGEQLNNDDYKKLEKQNKSPETYDPVVELHNYLVGNYKMRGFEKVEANTVSPIIEFDTQQLRQYIEPEEGIFKFDVVYADPLGKFFHKTVNIEDINKENIQN